MYVLLILSLLSFSLLCFSSCAPDRLRDFTAEPTQGTHQSDDEFKKQRRQMVERQLRARGIRDGRALAAMEKVPRHRFVPPAAAHLAYADHPLPIGQEQTISQPYIVAYMTEAAEVSASDKVLEIGTGSGYQAAILGELAKEVYTIEIIPELADRARRTLEEMNYKNVHLKTGNGYLGWPEHAPFDAIVVTAAPDEVPPALIEQLAVNGKLVIPVGTGAQEMTVITKTEKGLIEQKTLAVRFVPMTGKPEN